jgi:alkylation response protein AidB-like acyl-CoA dehydrogenase
MSPSYIFPARHKGITAFIVEASNPGLCVGRNEHKLGIRASSTCEVSFTDCVVGPDAVLGGEGNGYKIAIGLLNEGRIGIAFQTVGLAQGAFDHAMQVRCILL